MQRSRAFRRHQYNRAKKRAIRFLLLAGLTPTERQIHLYAKHRKPCSCYWCSGNKREEHKDARRENKVLCSDMLEEWEASLSD